ncbi:hypothetical protein C8F04DRAFT_1279792 [Mycena alexandri]|uniref:Restriction of telomere capping protein 4 n=1 Tax=Mycena alexandri TaxID=1745969 RepID=A0AAD6RXL3_9AGAR|nr:hypothetical protein C8F04DRAFT_1279792 [Mycena alexandri]
MPRSKSKTTAAEEVLRLQEEMRKKDEQIAGLLLKEKRAAEKQKSVHKIPRPSGQAGRASGYNLREEMGLAEDGERYNRIFRIVKDNTHQFLAVKDTISKQNKVQVEAALSQIAKTAPYFARFEGYWPARDMITTYLLNMQTRRNKDLRMEREADLNDHNAKTPSRKSKLTADDGSTDESDVPTRKHVVKRPTKRRVDLCIHSEDENADDEPPVKPHKKKRKTYAAMDSDNITDYEPPAKARAAMNSDEENFEPAPTTGNNKRSGRAPAGVPAAKKIKLNLTPKTVLKNEPELRWNDLPYTCIRCPEILPVDPNARILSMFVQREKLLGEVGSAGPGVALLELQICAAITEEKDRQRHQKLGEKNGWPQTIDFGALGDRVYDLREQLADMLLDPNVLQESAAWKNFVKSIDYNLFYFCRSRSKAEFIYAVYASRCGYYGPKGAEIIKSMLMEMFMNNIDNVENTLFATLNELVILNEDSFDRYDETSNLLDIEDFTSFVLLPFMASHLIAQDKSVKFEDAVDICDESSTFGEIFHALTSNGKDIPVGEEEPQKLKAEKKSQVTLLSFEAVAHDKLPSPKTKPKKSPAEEQPNSKSKKAGGVISLNDFEEPGEKTKKDKKPKPPVKPKPKENKIVAPRPKPNPIKSSYGTRSKTRN